jgi:hypothetical protein
VIGHRIDFSVGTGSAIREGQDEPPVLGGGAPEAGVVARRLREEFKADDLAMPCLEPEAAGLHNGWLNVAPHPQKLITLAIRHRSLCRRNGVPRGE